jgi:hypothetical protein
MSGVTESCARLLRLINKYFTLLFQILSSAWPDANKVPNKLSTAHLSPDPIPAQAVPFPFAIRVPLYHDYRPPPIFNENSAMREIICHQIPWHRLIILG